MLKSITSRMEATVKSNLRESLCIFEWTGQRFRAFPQNIFRPSGLIIWGAPLQAEIHLAQVGKRQQLIISSGWLPARWFAQADSFDQIVKQVEAGKEPPAWGTWDTADIGYSIQVEVRSKDGKALGPDDGIELVMWGHSVEC